MDKIIFFNLFFLLMYTCAIAGTSVSMKGYCIKVADGDTIYVRIDGKVKTVRLLGIDTPEVDGPYTKKEFFGTEASTFTKKIVMGKPVTLTLGNERHDKYGRLLAYVYLKDGILLNKLLIQEGYARAYKIFNHPQKNEFIKSERKAKVKCLGLWKPDCNK